jgi:energy-converting hydrogenase A subunit I
MNKQSIISSIILIISIVSIIYAIIFNPADWMVYGISIVFIPLGILSFGLLIMAKAKKEDKDDRRKEPFIGY